MCSVIVSRKPCSLLDNVEKHCRVREAADKVAHAPCMLYKYGYTRASTRLCLCTHTLSHPCTRTHSPTRSKHTHTHTDKCNTTMVSQTLLSITLYVHCLSCLIHLMFRAGSYEWRFLNYAESQVDTLHKIFIRFAAKSSPPVLKFHSLHFEIAKNVNLKSFRCKFFRRHFSATLWHH